MTDDALPTVNVWDLNGSQVEQIERELGVPMDRWFNPDQPSRAAVYYRVYAYGRGMTLDDAYQLPIGKVLAAVVVTDPSDAGDTDTVNPT